MSGHVPVQALLKSAKIILSYGQIIVDCRVCTDHVGTLVAYYVTPRLEKMEKKVGNGTAPGLCQQRSARTIAR